MNFTNTKNINLTFTKDVLDLFKSHKQLSIRDLEAGGQLFAYFGDNRNVLISKATGLRPGDKRGRFLFWPNRRRERKEIKDLFAQGYHYVGDWHTHPQRIPTPSEQDIKSAFECYEKSQHNLKHFIMVIVGTDNFPNGISVSIHNSETIIPCTLESFI